MLQKRPEFSRLIASLRKASRRVRVMVQNQPERSRLFASVRRTFYRVRVMVQNQPERSLLALIGVLYLVIAWGYAVRTPDWQIPDEPAHYNYIRQIAEDGEIPVIEPGDWNDTYLFQLKLTRFAPDVVDRPQTPEVDIHSVQYEDHQPPLYYLLQAPIYAITDGDIEALRLFSAVIGFGVVVCVWLIGRKLFPDKPWLGLTAAAFVAFLPQRLAMMAGINNDSLAETLAAVVFVLVVYYLLSPPLDWQLPLAMGFVVGLIFLTKSTVYYISAIAGLAILARWYWERWSRDEALRPILAFAIPALVLGLIWWIHSLDVYGGTDFLGLQRHDEVVVGQPRTGDYIDDVYGGSRRVYLENMASTTFNSFWGQFGWMAVPMPDRVYRIIQIFLIVSLLGLVFYRPRLEPIDKILVALFALSIALVLAQFLIYNLTFVQFQGRYLYPALVPMALLVALGLSGWSSLLVDRNWWLGWLAIVPMFGLAVLAWYALNTYVVPNL